MAHRGRALEQRQVQAVLAQYIVVIPQVLQRLQWMFMQVLLLKASRTDVRQNRSLKKNATLLLIHNAHCVTTFTCATIVRCSSQCRWHSDGLTRNKMVYAYDACVNIMAVIHVQTKRTTKAARNAFDSLERLFIIIQHFATSPMATSMSNRVLEAHQLMMIGTIVNQQAAHQQCEEYSTQLHQHQ